MKPKTIGIVGGAGPQAGAFLLQRVICLANTTYGCHRDSDFPRIILISFPFSEMLSPIIDVEKLQNELRRCLEQLRSNGASVLAIACNTLHAFLEEEDMSDDLIHLPQALVEKIPLSEQPLVLCTSTSAQFRLHQQFFPCTYPDAEIQEQVDIIIDQILQGAGRSTVLNQLEKILQEQAESTLILGCTELSLFMNELSLPNKLILDPLEIVANKILQKSFLK